MPQLISRDQALQRINATLQPGECLACHVLSSSEKHILSKGEFTTTRLSEFPRTWGQTMVLLNEHKTSFAEITDEEWSELTTQVRKATLLLEKVLKPLRCYISLMGSKENLPNTCPHIHFNIIPVYSEEEKPSVIYTWEHGLYTGEEAEWTELMETLRKASMVV